MQREESFTYISSINIAVAVANNGILSTPVLQDADKGLSHYPIWVCLELIDSMLSFLPGQRAIMAVGASKPSVIADSNGFFSIEDQLLVNVTADHRIIYGADLAASLQTLSKIIENPESLTM